jgi:sec-independent protein translocase protein TatB
VIGNLHGAEIMLLIVMALLLLGPDKLPEYAAKLARAVRALRDLAEGAKTQIRDEMGPAFDDVNWRALDPRQYDPRRIVREALTTPPRNAPPSAAHRAGQEVTSPQPGGVPRRGTAVHDPQRPTPFDVDAT